MSYFFKKLSFSKLIQPIGLNNILHSAKYINFEIRSKTAIKTTHKILSVVYIKFNYVTTFSSVDIVHTVSLIFLQS